MTHFRADFNVFTLAKVVWEKNVASDWERRQYWSISTVELRYTLGMNYRKDSDLMFRAAGGKIGKPKHNYKIHLFGGISRRGLTRLVLFTGTMYSKDYQNFLTASKVLMIREKFNTLKNIFTLFINFFL